MRIKITPDFCIFVALSVLALPIQWVFAWLVASAVHEMFHCIALTACGARIYIIKLGMFGASIETETLTARHELISAAAGPLGGLLLLFLFRLFPMVGICALVQSVFNLLPVYPFDGGRVYRCCIRYLFCDQTAEKICRHTENAVIGIMLCITCFVIIRYDLGFLPLAVFALVFLKWRKTPCKQSEQIVQ